MSERWIFNALDTLFFRESRPMESVGASQLQSVFPPPARTLIGAVRTAVGESLAVNWQEYARDVSHPLRQRIGTPETLAPMTFCGPYLLSAGNRLYPIPLAALFAQDGQTRLLPGNQLEHCDLGRVALPVKQNPELAGASPKEGALISAQGLLDFLEGRSLQDTDIHAADTLFVSEERLGIARDNHKRVTGDGLLYQTNHIRPRHDADLAIGMDVHGLAGDGLAEQGSIRLGAEGRLATWHRTPNLALPAVAAQKAKGLLLVLLTPALFKEGWLPDGLVWAEENGQTVWRGVLNGVQLKLICSVVGKPVREGGWDMVNHCPRPLQSLAPAGSCYFCEVDGDLQAAQHALHGVQIGLETEYGRGQIAAGYWN